MLRCSLLLIVFCTVLQHSECFAYIPRLFNLLKFHALNTSLEKSKFQLDAAWVSTMYCKEVILTFSKRPLHGNISQINLTKSLRYGSA